METAYLIIPEPLRKEDGQDRLFKGILSSRQFSETQSSSLSLSSFWALHLQNENADKAPLPTIPLPECDVLATSHYWFSHLAAFRMCLSLCLGCPSPAYQFGHFLEPCPPWGGLPPPLPTVSCAYTILCLLFLKPLIWH